MARAALIAAPGGGACNDDGELQSRRSLNCPFWRESVFEADSMSPSSDALPGFRDDRMIADVICEIAHRFGWISTPSRLLFVTFSLASATFSRILVYCCYGC